MDALIDLTVRIIAQLCHSIGAIVLFGFLIAWCNRRFYNWIGPSSETVCHLTGAIGTPIHELGHAFFCVVFRHEIVDIALYKIDRRNGSLGYVRHRYNPASFYQRAGNFFIGIGPILFGSAVLLLLMRVMAPETFDSLRYTLRRFDYSRVYGGFDQLAYCLKALWWQFGDFFNPRNFTSILWWLYLAVGCLIALHMDLSRPDIEGAKPGALLFAGVIVAANVILFLLGGGVQAGFHHGFIRACLFIIGILGFSLMFSLVCLLVAFVVNLVRAHGRT